MRGQWIGGYTGTNSGSAIVDVDEVADRLKGYAYMYDNNAGLPSTRADINVIKPSGNSFQGRLPLLPIDRNMGDTDLTGLFWTKRCEKMSLERSFSHAEEEVYRRADRDAASSG